MADDTGLPRDPMILVRQRFQACVEAEASYRKNALTDLKFRAGTDGEKSYQWPDTIQTERSTDGRPCLTINRIDAFLKQVENQQRQAGPAIQVLPVGDDADEETAEALQGIIRHIQSVSDGEIAIDTAFNAAITHGKGYALVLPRYLDEASNEQELSIERVRNPFTVYIDPAATKPDLSDARYAFIVEDLSKEEYDALYPDSTAATMTDFHSIGDATQRVTWFPTGQVRIATYYALRTTTTQTRGTQARRVKKQDVLWQKINGLEVLEETVLPITRIPIVPCFGDEFDIDGQVDYRGMVRNSRDPQKMFNFWITAITEAIALAPKGKWLIEAGQIEGFEDFWKNSNRSNPAYLPWKGTDANGIATGIGAPTFNVAEPPIQAMAVAVKIADDNLKAVMQLYDPSLGERKSDQSGRAILALQQQGEIGNANYIDNLKRFLRSLGRLLIEMIPHYYDTPRVLRIIGKDDNPRQIMVHAGQPPEGLQPGPDGQPNPEALKALKQQKGIEQIYDLGVGRYDVTVTTGPNFVSKRQEAVSAMLEVAKVSPQTMPVWIDLLFKNSDWPGAMEIYERMKDTVSAQFQKHNGDGPDPAQLQAQLQQIMQQHDLLVKELKAKTQALETDQAKYEAQVAIESLKQQGAVELQRMKDATTVTVAQINAMTKGVTMQTEAENEAAALAADHVHAATQAHADRLHEATMASMSHDQALEQGEVAHGQGLEAAQQQADLQPPPPQAGA